MNDGSGGVFVFWAVILGLIVWFGWLGDSKFRYEIQYDAEVTVGNKPHDCEFLTAPMGRKNCSYEKKVSIMRFSKDKKTGDAIISYDEGKTWQWNRGGPTNGSQVSVYWVRTED